MQSIRLIAFTKRPLAASRMYGRDGRNERLNTVRGGQKMLKDHYEKYYYDGNYNCAETIIRAANEYYDLGLHDADMIAYGGFGAGIQTGNTCGAVISAVAVLSMRYIETKAHESKDIKPQSFTPQLRCKKTIETACDILEEVINEYDKTRTI